MKFDLYDFDGTIYDGDSGVDFIKYSIKHHKGTFKCLLGAIWTVFLFILKLRTKEQMKNRIFRFVKDIDNIDEYVKGFWEEHEHQIKSFWTEKKDHSKDIIISASCRFWLQPIADKYKVYDLFATDIDMKTGEIIGNNCHGKEKVRLFYDKYPKGKIMKMYTDSVNDLPLIEEANEGILVKKDKLYNYYEYKPNILVRFWRWGWGIYHKNEMLWNYLIVGGLTTVVAVGVKWGLYFTVLDVNNGFQAQVGVIISWIAAVLFAYVTNRIYVFKSKSKKILKEMINFFGARLLTLAMEALLTFIFFTLLGLTSNTWVIIVTVIIQVLVMVFNFIFSKIFVFKKEK